MRFNWINGILVVDHEFYPPPNQETLELIERMKALTASYDIKVLLKKASDYDL